MSEGAVGLGDANVYHRPGPVNGLVPAGEVTQFICETVVDRDLQGHLLHKRNLSADLIVAAAGHLVLQAVGVAGRK